MNLEDLERLLPQTPHCARMDSAEDPNDGIQDEERSSDEQRPEQGAAVPDDDHPHPHAPERNAQLAPHAREKGAPMNPNSRADSRCADGAREGVTDDGENNRMPTSYTRRSGTWLGQAENQHHSFARIAS